MKFTSNRNLLLIGLYFLLIYTVIQTSFTRSCHAPVTLFDWSGYSRPHPKVERLIMQFGGLPKTRIDLTDARLDNSQFYPVDQWHIPTSKVTRGGFSQTFDGNPKYHHDFDIYVTYQDGDQAIIRWSSWSFGWLFCPFVISQESVKPGRLDVISHATPLNE